MNSKREEVYWYFCYGQTKLALCCEFILPLTLTIPNSQHPLAYLTILLYKPTVPLSSQLPNSVFVLLL